MTAPRPIFIHGAIGGSAVWGSLPSRFDGAVVLRLPGHPEGTAIADETELVSWITLAVAQHAGSRVLIGHGLGALLALEVARRYPEVLDGVVMLGAGPRLYVPHSGGEAQADTAGRLIAVSMREPDGAIGDAVAAGLRDHRRIVGIEKDRQLRFVEVGLCRNACRRLDTVGVVNIVVEKKAQRIADAGLHYASELDLRKGGVAGKGNILDRELFAFLDLEDEIHPAVVAPLALDRLRHHLRVEIAMGPIEIENVDDVALNKFAR